VHNILFAFDGRTHHEWGGKLQPLRFRPAEKSDQSLVFELLKNAALWLQDRQICHLRVWLNPSPGLISWILQGFENGEFNLIYLGEKVIGCFRLQWSDELFWGKSDEPAGYVHSFAIDRSLAGQHLGERTLALIGEHCLHRGRDWLRLDCETDNHRLRNYYERCGFCRVREVPIKGGGWTTLYEKRI